MTSTETRTVQERLRDPIGIFDPDIHMEAADRIDTLGKALSRLLNYVERNTCQHDETHRGGALWEICDQCGAKWADDRGGKPKFKWHSDVTNARAALSPPSDNSDAQAGSMK